MSVEGRVQQLESLLARVQSKRRPGAGPASVLIAPMVARELPMVDDRPTPVPAAPSEEAAAAVVQAPRGLQSELTPLRTPTPMEQALRSGFDAGRPAAPADDEPELTFDDDEPQVSTDSHPDLLLVDSDEPDLGFDDEPLLEEKPTAPLAGRGVRSPTADPEVARTAPLDTRAPSALERAPTAAAPEPARAQPQRPEVARPEVARPEPARPVAMRADPPVDTAPRAVAIPRTQAASPVAKVVSRPEPITFAALLDRSLALRPR